MSRNDEEFERNVDAFWEHLQTTATAEERERWQRILEHDRARKPWWRLLGRFGLRPRIRLPGQPAPPPPAPRVVHPPGFPTEGSSPAHEHEIDQEVVNYGPGPAFPGVEVKNVLTQVATLGEIVNAGDADELLNAITSSHQEGESGAYGLYHVPTSVREALASATDLNAVADRWGATEELQDWSSVAEIVEELHDLARRAQREGKELWVWWSL